MGNACDCGRDDDPQIKESNRAIRTADAICGELGMHRRTGEQGRYIRRIGKWTFSVVDDRHSNRRYRIELLSAPIDDVPGGNWKWLQGDHYTTIRYYSVTNEYSCFVYDTMGNVREIISEQHMPLGRDREEVITKFLPDIFAGLKDLGLLGLHHTALSWDAIEVGSDNRARIGSLEYLVDRKQAASHRLSDTRHLPPESLRICSGKAKTQQDLAKREIWIIGSLLLEIMLHKHVSGSDFVLSRSRPSRSQALRSIDKNVPRLALLLDDTTLSQRMQQLIKDMLVIDVRGRMSLDQALSQYGGAAVSDGVGTSSTATSETSQSTRQRATGGKRTASSRKKTDEKTKVSSPLSRRPQRSGHRNRDQDQYVNVLEQESSASEEAKPKGLSDCFRCTSPSDKSTVYEEQHDDEPERESYKQKRAKVGSSKTRKRDQDHYVNVLEQESSASEEAKSKGISDCFRCTSPSDKSTVYDDQHQDEPERDSHKQKRAKVGSSKTRKRDQDYVDVLEQESSASEEAKSKGISDCFRCTSPSDKSTVYDEQHKDEPERESPKQKRTKVGSSKMRKREVDHYAADDRIKVTRYEHTYEREIDESSASEETKAKGVSDCFRCTAPADKSSVDEEQHEDESEGESHKQKGRSSKTRNAQLDHGTDNRTKVTHYERTYEREIDESSASEETKKKGVSDCFRCTSPDKSSDGRDEPKSDTIHVDGDTTDDGEAKGLVVAARRFLHKSKEKDTNIVAASDGRPGSPNVLISIKFTSPNQHMETSKSIHLEQQQHHHYQKNQIEDSKVGIKSWESTTHDGGGGGGSSCCGSGGGAIRGGGGGVSSCIGGGRQSGGLKPIGERKSSSAPSSPSLSSSVTMTPTPSVVAAHQNLDVTSDLYTIPHSADVSSINTNSSKMGLTTGTDSTSDLNKAKGSPRSQTSVSGGTSRLSKSDVSSHGGHHSKHGTKYQSNVRYEAKYNVSQVTSKK